MPSTCPRANNERRRVPRAERQVLMQAYTQPARTCTHTPEAGYDGGHRPFADEIRGIRFEGRSYLTPHKINATPGNPNARARGTFGPTANFQVRRRVGVCESVELRGPRRGQLWTLQSGDTGSQSDTPRMVQSRTSRASLSTEEGPMDVEADWFRTCLSQTNYRIIDPWAVIPKGTSQPLGTEPRRKAAPRCALPSGFACA